jgi:hypothetical protein
MNDEVCLLDQVSDTLRHKIDVENRRHRAALKRFFEASTAVPPMRSVSTRVSHGGCEI